LCDALPYCYFVGTHTRKDRGSNWRKKKDRFRLQSKERQKGEAAARAKVMMDKMAELLDIRDEQVLLEQIETAFGITPGSPQFEAIMNVWRKGRS
jgi:hypothetical protein